LLDEGRTLANRVGTSFLAVFGRHPVPVVVLGLILALALRQKRSPRKVSGSVIRVSEAQPGLLSKMTGTAEEVFSKWAQAVSASLERAAIDATGHISESLVRAADTMIATALERFARSLSATEDKNRAEYS
jgi:hypothetical protein